MWGSPQVAQVVRRIEAELRTAGFRMTAESSEAPIRIEVSRERSENTPTAQPRAEHDELIARIATTKSMLRVEAPTAELLATRIRERLRLLNPTIVTSAIEDSSLDDEKWRLSAGPLILAGVPGGVFVGGTAGSTTRIFKSLRLGLRGAAAASISDPELDLEGRVDRLLVRVGPVLEWTLVRGFDAELNLSIAGGALYVRSNATGLQTELTSGADDGWGGFGSLGLSLDWAFGRWLVGLGAETMLTPKIREESFGLSSQTLGPAWIGGSVSIGYGFGQGISSR
ncbi:MAG: hypothetical protein ACFB9M_05065 [Myxococcota bacterium]